jgi:hypothetical protein
VAETLTVKEVAARLRLSEAWVRDHIPHRVTGQSRRSPTLPCIRFGGAVRFEVRDVERFIEQCRMQAGELEKRAC